MNFQFVTHFDEIETCGRSFQGFFSNFKSKTFEAHFAKFLIKIQGITIDPYLLLKDFMKHDTWPLKTNQEHVYLMKFQPPNVSLEDSTVSSKRNRIIWKSFPTFKQLTEQTF